MIPPRPPRRLGAAGASSATLPGLLAGRVRATPTAPAYCLKLGGAWTPLSWAEFGRRVSAVAHALLAHGVTRGDRVGILGPTCIEWEYLQMAALRIGAIAVGIDPNYTDDTLNALLPTLGLAAVGVKDAATLARVPPQVLRPVKIVASFEGPMPERTPSISLAEAPAGRPDAPELDGPGADDAAITVFSSGTTGTPKPITYTHGQTLLAIEAIVGAFPDVGAGSRFACWLPLANLFQRIINFCAIEVGATSYMVSDPRALATELRAISPTLLIGVPRFYERLQAGISAELHGLPGLRGTVARWALELARRRALNLATTGDRALSRLADALVYSRIRATFGSRLRYLISGSAPMPAWLLAWYDALGLPVYEAYGVSEDIVPIAMNRPGRRRPGTVGEPLPPNEVQLADDGEILVRGPGVYRIGRGAPAGEGPGSAGYWATGDLGRFDAQGFLCVVGRKAELYKSPTGRWISPQGVEEALRRVPYVEHAVVVRTASGAVIALASFDREALLAHAAARGVEMPASPESELREDVARLVQGDFGDAASALGVSERPHALILVRRAFTVEGGELTTNLKLRRQAIEARYRQDIERASSAIASRSAAGGAAPASPLVLVSS